jgi:hypothetical protein
LNYIYCFEKVRAAHFIFFSSFLFPRRLTSGSSEGGPEGSDFEEEREGTDGGSDATQEGRRGRWQCRAEARTWGTAGRSPFYKEEFHTGRIWDDH